MLGTNSVKDGKSLEFEQDHGWIFEVLADGTSSPQPLKAMGRFVHEATAIDPQTGVVYETEDRGTAAFCRFIASTNQKLSEGSLFRRVAGMATASSIWIQPVVAINDSDKSGNTILSRYSSH